MYLFIQKERGARRHPLDGWLTQLLADNPILHDVVYNNVEFTVFLTDDVQEFNTGLANIVEIEVSLREAI